MAQLESLKDSLLIKDYVYKILKREILKGGFEPGETLNILNISKQMNISCAPIREALNMLGKDGLVELMPYKKAIVANGCKEDYYAAFDMRMFLEPYSARLSVSLIPQEEITRVREQLQAVLNNPEDLSAYLDSDMVLHEMLYRHSPSKLLISIMDTIRTYTMRYYSQRLQSIAEVDGDDSQNKSAAVKDQTLKHLTILDAAESRDADLVYELLYKHIKE